MMFAETREDVLSGTFCQGCGTYIGKSIGHPRHCVNCVPTQRMDTIRLLLNFKPRQFNIKCDKYVKLIGLSNHIKDTHNK